MKILLLEDDFVLNDLINDELTKNNYEIESVYHGEEALKKVRKEKYDIYLFDINVPGIKGSELLKIIRKENNNTPTIFITSLNDTKDMVNAFEIGCDDYIKKPFEMEELLVRLKNVKRLHKIEIEQIKLMKNLIYKRKENTMEKNGIKYELTKKECEFIDYFIRKKGIVLSFNELCMNVWRYDDRPTESTIRTYVKNLRKKFGEDLFITVKGSGYKINI